MTIRGARSRSTSVCLAGLIVSGLAMATDYEIESCQFIAERQDASGHSVPPGLDEPINCDHKCFYDELGLDFLGGTRPTLHDMYSIGWRLIAMQKTLFKGRLIWTVYLERESNSITNKCEKMYAPKRPIGSGGDERS